MRWDSAGSPLLLLGLVMVVAIVLTALFGDFGAAQR